MGPPSGPPPGGPPTARRTSRGRRRAVLITAGVVLVAAVVGGAFAARWYFHTGPQPAEALPASTMAYIAIDLDPNGQQKIAAHSLVGKFPASKSESVGSTGDARQWIVEKILDHSPCRDLSYADDVEPWLGSRAGLAAIDLDGIGVQPVIVLQSSDDDKADDGMKKLSECGGSDFGGWKVEDGWIVFAPSQEAADEAVKETGDHSLADDSGFKDAVGAAGGTGIMTGYVSKSAGDEFTSLMNSDGDVPAAILDQLRSSFPTTGFSVHAEGDGVRVDVAATADGAKSSGSSDVRSVLESLPKDSSAAGAFDLGAMTDAPGMGEARQGALDSFRAGLDEDGTGQEMEDSIANALGAPFEKVLDDLLHCSLAVALGPTADAVPESPEDLPLMVKLVPDAAHRDRVLGYFHSVEQHMDLGDDVTETDDGLVFGFTPQAREQSDTGGLTKSPRFNSVVHLGGHGVAAVLYADLQSGLIKAAMHDGLEGQDPRYLENLSHLDAAGLTAWLANGYAHTELRVSVD